MALKTLKKIEKDAAGLLGLIIFTREGFLEPKAMTQSKRFFVIANKLPLEMQMLLCNLCYSVVKRNFIAEKHIHVALWRWIKTLL
jgi:hypothetical protein